MVGGAQELRIAEALAARLCHELVSPIGAIANGVEILAEDSGFAADAGALIGQSAAQAARRLQFYRLAYGALAEIAEDTAREASLEFFAEGRCRCDWPVSAANISPGLVKTVMNLLLLASATLPRGGVVSLGSGATSPVITAQGAGARIETTLVATLAPDIDADMIGPRTVQAIFTAALARRNGLKVLVAADGPDRISVRLAPL